MTITFRNTFLDRLAFAAHPLPRHPLVLLMSVSMWALITFGAFFDFCRQRTEEARQAVPPGAVPPRL